MQHAPHTQLRGATHTVIAVEISQGPAARTAPLLGASLEPTLTWISAIRSYFMAAFSQSPFPSSQMVDSLWKSGIAAAEPMTRHRRMNFMRASEGGEIAAREERKRRCSVG